MNRWFIFWMACFMVAAIKDAWALAIVFLIWAALTSDEGPDKEGGQ